MSHPMLKFIAGKKPIFDTEYAILSAPVRHIFMMACVWQLTRQAKQPNLQILEIGSWVGASALSFAQGLVLHNDAQGTITCLDAWQPFFDRALHQDQLYIQMEQALSSETAYQLFLHNISTLPPSIICQHLRGKSSHLLPLLESDSFDIVFIDADHTYHPVLADIKNSMRLVKEGGIICGDDLNLQLHEVDSQYARAHDNADFISDPLSKRNYHPGVTLAVAEVFGEVSSWGGFWAMQKKKGSFQKISMADMPVHYPTHFPAAALQKAQAHFNDLTIR